MRSVVTALSTLLRRVLPQSAFDSIRFRWLAMTSWFIKRPPEVRSFGSDGESDLVTRLQAVNAVAPTKMCRVMYNYGSDKGYGRHNYTVVYSVLFEPYRDRPLRVFELGLGTNNTEVASNMGIQGRPGASLRGWRDLFPLAQVFGADIDRGILFQENRIKTFYCDQLDPAAIRAMWSQPDLQDGMDIIIEDGLHTFDANVSFLEGSLEQLRPGGIYVVEDIARDCIDRWYDQLANVYSKRYPKYEFAFLILPNPVNAWDNNLLVVRRNKA